VRPARALGKKLLEKKALLKKQRAKEGLPKRERAQRARPASRVRTDGAARKPV
jgi:hypothetical protein